MLRHGGLIVLHDFEEGTPMAAWFQHVVHRYSPAGHDYRHFTRSDMLSGLRDAGFTDVEVGDMYDPFQTSGASVDEAEGRLLDYVVKMYGLRLLGQVRSETAEVRRRVRRLLMDHIQYEPNGRLPDDCKRTMWTSTRNGCGVAELPRMALVAVGSKP